MNLSHIFSAKKISFIVFFSIFSLFFLVKASEASNKNALKSFSDIENSISEKEEENITGLILHHIADAHEWHFWGKGPNKVAMYLPVILWTRRGLVTFMSNKYRDQTGKEIFYERDQGLINFHGKYYYASSAKNHHGSYVELDESHFPTNKKPLDLSITKNVLAMLISMVLLLIISISIARAYKNRVGQAPKGFQSFLEPIIMFIRDDVAKPQLGTRYRAFMPYLLTVFFFIWLNNLLGLVPIFPGGANLTGNIAITLMLALCTFILTIINGNKSYWHHIFFPSVPWWLYPLMVPVEIIGLFTKPLALTIRLFANITAGHILILSLICLIFILKSVFVAGAAIPFVLFISIIELVVGFIQAFIFTILSALFIGMAIQDPIKH